MAKAETTAATTRAPRGAKPAAQAFLDALELRSGSRAIRGGESRPGDDPRRTQEPSREAQGFDDQREGPPASRGEARTESVST